MFPSRRVRPTAVSSPTTRCSPTSACATHDNGWVAVDATEGTGIPGVWAAGTRSTAQVIYRSRRGSAAAIAINNDLVDEDLPIAVTNFSSTSPSSITLPEANGVRTAPSAALTQPISRTEELTRPSAAHPHPRPDDSRTPGRTKPAGPPTPSWQS